jgi:hypothetical protein
MVATLQVHITREDYEMYLGESVLYDGNVGIIAISEICGLSVSFILDLRVISLNHQVVTESYISLLFSGE